MHLLVAVPEEEAVRVCQVVVALDVELVVFAILDRVEQVVVDDLSVRLSRAGRVRLRVKLGEHVARNRVDAAIRDDVPGERYTRRGRIVDDARQLGEVTRPHFHRRDRRQRRHALCLAMPLIVTKEERLVLEDRAAQSATELVLLEVRFGAAGAVVEKVIGVERVVAVELESAAAHPVGAGLDLQVDDAAERPAELGRIGRSLELELIERVDAREDDDGLQPRFVVVDAVKHVVVVARTLAVGGKRGGGAPRETTRSVDVRPRNATQHAGNRAGEVDEVAAVEGQRFDLLAADRRAQLGGGRLDQGRLGGDADRFGHRAHFVLDVDAHALIDTDLDVGERDGLEARHLRGDGVVAGRQRRSRVLAVGVCNHDPSETRSFIDDRDLRAGDDSAGGIRYRAKDGAADRLSGRRGRQPETERPQNEHGAKSPG